MSIKIVSGDVVVHKAALVRAGSVFALSMYAAMTENRMAKAVAGALALGIATTPFAYSAQGQGGAPSGTGGEAPA